MISRRRCKTSADPQLSELTADLLGGTSLGDERSVAVATLRSVLPPATLRSITESTIEALILYLRGDSKRIDNEVDLNETLANLNKAVGQQTANLPGGIGAVRTGTGQYTVTFNANTGTGRFSGVDNLSDLAIQATSRDTAYGDAAVITTGSSANENQVIVRVHIRNNANNLIDRDFSVQFYANE